MTYNLISTKDEYTENVSYGTLEGSTISFSKLDEKISDEVPLQRRGRLESLLELSIHLILLEMYKKSCDETVTDLASVYVEFSIEPSYADVRADYYMLHLLYELINRDKIKDFLEEHDYLYPILIEAEEKIHEIFGEKAKLCLELYHDIEEGWEELVIIIKSPYSMEKAQELDDRLADEWFLDKMDETRGKLNIIEEPL